ncbi:MAG: hypothetical protein ABIR62_02280 [Dokdonella sp.]|uniref:hypothetical protein n=1 Tax=Dokdonella sp. TaxID=2291710 RepID=UPI0032661A06
MIDARWLGLAAATFDSIAWAVMDTKQAIANAITGKRARIKDIPEQKKGAAR